MLLFPVVTFRCYVGVVDDARSDAVVFQGAVVFFLTQLQLFSVEDVLLVWRIFLLCFFYCGL